MNQTMLLYYNMSNKNPLPYIHSFNLDEIVYQAHLNHEKQHRQKQEKQSKIPISYALSRDGIALLQLFGYHFGRKLEEKLADTYIKKNIIRLNYSNFQNLVVKHWINLGEYRVAIPLIFDIFQVGGTISIAQLDKYVAICGKELNPFMAALKQKHSSSQLHTIRQKIIAMTDSEDLRETGFVDRNLVEEVFRRQLQDAKMVVNFENQLKSNQDINYRLLVGEKYLNSGGQLREFLEGKLVNKLVKFIRKSNRKKKSKPKRKQIRKPADRKKRQTRQEKLTKQFITDNKKQKKQDHKRVQFMVKQLIYYCIAEASACAQTTNQSTSDQSTSKCIYTAQPTIVEHVFEGQPALPLKVCVSQGGTGLFVWQNQCKMINLSSGHLCDEIDTTASNCLSASPILDYCYHNSTFFVLREDGLLYSLGVNLKSYQNIIQTNLTHHTYKLEQYQSRTYIQIRQGLLFLNNCLSQSIQIYSLSLKYVATMWIDKKQLGVASGFIQEAAILREKVVGKEKVDKVLNCYHDYCLLLGVDPTSVLPLGSFLFSKYPQVSIEVVQEYAKWLFSFRQHNPIPLPKRMWARMQSSNPYPQDFQYLLKYNYISSSSPEQMVRFSRQHSISEVSEEERRQQLVTLYEDNKLQELSSPSISKEQFDHWLQPCNLSPDEKQLIRENSQYDAIGNILMKGLVRSEHYLRINSYNKMQFQTNDCYKHLELPYAIINHLFAIPVLDICLLACSFPVCQLLYVVPISTAKVARKIDLNAYGNQQEEFRGKGWAPCFAYCEQTGYLAAGYGRGVTIWNCEHIKEQLFPPIRVLSNVDQPDAIIQMHFMYNSSTLVVSSPSSAKLFDLKSLFSTSKSSSQFILKPGYKARQLVQSSKYSPQKKLIPRGVIQSVFSSPTRHRQYILGIVSADKTKCYLKLLYVHKFAITIKEKKKHEGVPFKIMKMLGDTARRHRFGDCVLGCMEYSCRQIELAAFLEDYYRGRSLRKGKDGGEGRARQVGALVHSLNEYHNISTNTPKMSSPEMQSLSAKILKPSLLLKLLTSPLTKASLLQIFTSNFLQLYEQQNRQIEVKLKSQNGQIDVKSIWNDICDSHQRIMMRRILCMCGLIDRLTRQLEGGCLVVKEGTKICVKVVKELLEGSEMEAGVIEGCVSYINMVTFQEPFKLLETIIDKYLPTEYKFISLRYYKNIQKHTPQSPCDYFLSRKDRYESPEHLQRLLSPQSRHKSIIQYLQLTKKLPHLKSRVTQRPQIGMDNLKLIEECMAIRIVGQLEGTFYILQEPTNLTLNHVLGGVEDDASRLDINRIVGAIDYVLEKEELGLPAPQVAYQWFYAKFKDVFEGQTEMNAFFYEELKGSRTTHSIYSSQLSHNISQHRKSVSLSYQPTFWSAFLSHRVLKLAPIKHSLSKNIHHRKIISTKQFAKKMRELDISQPEIQQLAVRCAFASTNHKSFVDKFQLEDAARSTGMFVHLGYLVRYLQGYLDLQQVKPQKNAQSSEFKIHIPQYVVVREIGKCGLTMSEYQLHDLLSYNTSPFTYSQMLGFIAKNLSFTVVSNTRYITVSQLMSHLALSLPMLGQTLLCNHLKTNLTARCIVVNQSIDRKQLNQLLLSEGVATFVAESSQLLKGKNEFYDFKSVEQVVEQQIIGQGMQRLEEVMRFNLGTYREELLELTDHISKSYQQIDSQKIGKHFHHSCQLKQPLAALLICHLCQSKRVVLKQWSHLFQQLTSQGQKASRYQAYHRDLQGWLQQPALNYFKAILSHILPNRILNKSPIAQNLMITGSALSQISNIPFEWVLSYQPYLSIPQLLDYFYYLQDCPPDLVETFAGSCLMKMGVASFYEEFKEVGFVQFYNRTRKVSKNVSSLQTVDLIKLWRAISEEQATITNTNRANRRISIDKLLRIAQKYITNEARVLSILEYIEKQSTVADGKGVMGGTLLQMANLSCIEADFPKIAISFNYQQYLIKKNTNSYTQMYDLVNSLKNEDLFSHHMDKLSFGEREHHQIRTYLLKNGTSFTNHLRELEGREGKQEVEEGRERELVRSAVDFIHYIDQLLAQGSSPNPNLPIHEPAILCSQIYRHMRLSRTPQYSCSNSHMALYSYCQDLLVNDLLKRHNYRQIVADQLKQCCRQIEDEAFFDLMGFAFYENLVKYLPFCVGAVDREGVGKYWSSIKPYLIESFAKYDSHGKSIRYPIRFGTFSKMIGKSSTNKNKTLSEQSHALMLKQLNIWGCGQVNLNDIPSQRMLDLKDPYVDINQHISQKYPLVQTWKYINPPSQLKKKEVIDELLQYEQLIPAKVKVISKDLTYKIIGMHLTEDHRLYMEHALSDKADSKRFDLVALIYWIFDTFREEEDNQFAMLQSVVQQIEKDGGVYRVWRNYQRALGKDTLASQLHFIKQIVQDCERVRPAQVLQAILKVTSMGNIKQFIEVQGQSGKKENSKYLLQCLMVVVDGYNSQIRQWNNYNNPLVTFLNQLPQSHYTLLQKLFSANHHRKVHQLFDLLSNGQAHFTFSTFLQYCTKDSQVHAFSIQELQQVYNVIDVNGDGDITYHELLGFWSAVQQIFTPDPSPPLHKSMRMKDNIINTFLQILSPYYTSDLGNDQNLTFSKIEGLTNIRNKQKIERLINLFSQSPYSKKTHLDSHKLKVLCKKLAVSKQQATQQNQVNLMVSLFAGQVRQFIKAKDNLAVVLAKWMVASFPNYGHYLAQYFHDTFQFDRHQILAFFDKLSIKEKETAIKKNSYTTIKPNNDLYAIFEQVKHLLDGFYKKNKDKSGGVHTFGKSIAYKLQVTRNISKYQVMLQEVHQIIYFLTHSVDPKQHHLIYSQQQAELVDQYFQATPHLQIERISKIFAQSKGQVTKTTTANIEFHQQQQQNEGYLKMQHLLTNNDLKCKSGNRFTLTQFTQCCQDKSINLGHFSQKQSNSNKLVIYYNHKQMQQYVCLANLKINNASKFAALGLMTKLTQLIWYAEKKYCIYGLANKVDALYVLRDYEQQEVNATIFKLDYCYHGIKLDQEENYIEGINPLELYGAQKQLIVAPQLHQNILTYGQDAYALAHILYYFYSGKWVPSFPPSHCTVTLEQNLFEEYSPLHKLVSQQIQLLSLKGGNRQVQSQIAFLSLIFECTHYQWYLRPKLYQILQTLTNLATFVDQMEYIGRQVVERETCLEVFLRMIQEKQVSKLESWFKVQDYDWQMADLIKIRQKLPEQPSYYMFYNNLLNLYFQKQSNTVIEDFSSFMDNLVEYLCNTTTKQNTFIVLQFYNDIITRKETKDYFNYCDELWRISQFNVRQKLVQLNMKSRIDSLLKNSQFYVDLSTLTESKITLFLSEGESKAKKADSTKKIAMSFIQSSLLSNNVNKISALQKSNILRNLYRYVYDRQFEEIVLNIYVLISNCLNPQENGKITRTIEEGYKIMMVMYNIISLSARNDGKKSTSVIDMLTYMNDYYSFYGEECKSQVMRQIFEQYVCNLPTFSTIFNHKFDNNSKAALALGKFLINISYCQNCFKMLNTPTVCAFDSTLKWFKTLSKVNPQFLEVKKSIESNMRYHNSQIKLFDLDEQSQQLQSSFIYINSQNASKLLSRLKILIGKHVTFFHKKQQKKKSPIVNFKFQNDFYLHYSKFLKNLKDICLSILEESFFNEEFFEVVQAIVEAFWIFYDLWICEEELIEFMLELLTKIYKNQELYVQSKILKFSLKNILEILVSLVRDKKMGMVKLGYLHYFIQTVKRQYELMQKYISFKVENIKLKEVYVEEAQYRLNTLNELLQDNSQEINRSLIVLQFPKFLVQYMLKSQIMLDLRFYKANFNVVPFRYCNPFRSEAIIILSFILIVRNSPLKSELVSRILPLMKQQKENLDLNIQGNDINRMKFIESLWLFGNLMECEDDRLRYQLVNNGTYERINQLLSVYPALNEFFPKMTETIKSGTLLNTSFIFSQKLLAK